MTRCTLSELLKAELKAEPPDYDDGVRPLPYREPGGYHTGLSSRSWMTIVRDEDGGWDVVMDSPPPTNNAVSHEADYGMLFDMVTDGELVAFCMREGVVPGQRFDATVSVEYFSCGEYGSETDVEYSVEVHSVERMDPTLSMLALIGLLAELDMLVPEPWPDPYCDKTLNVVMPGVAGGAPTGAPRT